jgi:hypothetical protein
MAVFMISIFAALLISELGATHTEFAGDNRGNSLSSFNFSHESVPLSAGGDPGGDPCGDPCHSGICHFGHCTHIEIHGQGYVFFPMTSSGWIQLSSNSLPSPYLDHWKRPPRFGLLS